MKRGKMALSASVAGGLAVAVLMSSAALSRAAVLASDSFDYSDGNLVGNTPPVGGAWAAHSGAGAMPVQVAGGKIDITEGSGTREDVNIPFANSFTAGDGDVLYSAFDVTVSDPGAAITSVYFAHFLAGTSSFASRLWVTAPTTSGYQLALTNNSTLSATTAAFSGDLAFGTTYTVVTSYDYTNKVGKLWINPTDINSPSQTAPDGGFSDHVTAYAFRQATGNTTEVIDNLKVGTAFSDVVAVPEPSVICLGGIGVLLGLARRRRQSA